MLRELELLKRSEVVESYEILDYKEGSDFYFLKIKARLIDGSVLYVREFVSSGDYNYSFQMAERWKIKDSLGQRASPQGVANVPAPQARWR